MSHCNRKHKSHFAMRFQGSWQHCAVTWVPDSTHHPPGAAHRSSSARAFCRNWNFLLSWRSLKEERERKPVEGELQVRDYEGLGVPGAAAPPALQRAGRPLTRLLGQVVELVPPALPQFAFLAHGGAG